MNVMGFAMTLNSQQVDVKCIKYCFELQARLIAF